MSTVTQIPQLAVEADFGEPIFEHRQRITVDQYHRMSELGLLGEDPRCELIEGVIVAKMSKNPPHILSSDLIDALFHRILPAGFFVSMANPLTLAERDSEPEPDAQVFRGSPRDYKGRRRTQRDSALVIEISDSTYRIDRYRKWVTYAAVGVPFYWIVDVKRNRLEVHSAPKGLGDEACYSRTEIFGPDDEVALILDGAEVARFLVREILP
jgi:Uma2 family endonuclease